VNISRGGSLGKDMKKRLPQSYVIKTEKSSILEQLRDYKY
jgi:hypothetical protein